MCVLAVIGSYTFLPSLLASIVASSIQEGLGLDEAPEVDLKSDPPPNVFLGKFEEGRVTLKGAEDASEVVIDLDPFDLDVLGSLTSGRVRSREPLSGTLRAKLSEEQVTEIAASSAVAPVRDVELGEGSIIVGSEVQVLGVSVPVGAEGGLTLQNGVLRFEPQRIEALGEPVPDRLARRLLREADFSYPLGRLPGGGELSNVEVHEDQMVFTGEITLPTS